MLGLQIVSWAYIEAETDIYTGMHNHDDLKLQKMVTEAFEQSFDILEEARILMHCRALPGVVFLHGVSISTYPCRRVTGLLLEYLPRGDLSKLLCVSHLRWFSCGLLWPFWLLFFPLTAVNGRRNYPKGGGRWANARVCTCLRLQESRGAPRGGVGALGLL